MHDRGIYKGMFATTFHGQGDSGNREGIPVSELGAVAAFTDTERLFGKPHGPAIFFWYIFFHQACMLWVVRKE
jgi:hypothetical protein